MLNNEKRICMFVFSTNKFYNQWFKSIEQILNVLFKYKPKRNVGLLRCSKMTYFHLECQNPIKTSNNVLVFAPTFFFNSKNLECKFVINKNNLIIFINAPFLWKKSNFSHQFHKSWWFIMYWNFVPMCKTYFILFMVKIWNNLNKYC